MYMKCLHWLSITVNRLKQQNKFNSFLRDRLVNLERNALHIHIEEEIKEKIEQSEQIEKLKQNQLNQQYEQNIQNLQNQQNQQKQQKTPPKQKTPVINQQINSQENKEQPKLKYLGKARKTQNTNRNRKKKSNQKLEKDTKLDSKSTQITITLDKRKEDLKNVEMQLDDTFCSYQDQYHSQNLPQVEEQEVSVNLEQDKDYSDKYVVQLDTSVANNDNIQLNARVTKNELILKQFNDIYRESNSQQDKEKITKSNNSQASNSLSSNTMLGKKRVINILSDSNQATKNAQPKRNRKQNEKVVSNNQKIENFSKQDQNLNKVQNIQKEASNAFKFQDQLDNLIQGNVINLC